MWKGIKAVLSFWMCIILLVGGILGFFILSANYPIVPLAVAIFFISGYIYYEARD
jgi:hypothetical protein